MDILVTGITGTLGSHLLPMLLEDGHRVIGYSRDECKQKAIEPHENLTLYLGDIRDKERLLEATRNVSMIFHLAALKHVDIAEEQPEEFVKTNTLGTQNVLHAQRIHNIPRVVFSSTDKACHPINVYGMTKGIGERMVLRNTNNVVCRYGNVIASRGSVVPSFVKSIRDRNTFFLTDKRMTRFWVTPEKAAEFVFRSAFNPVGGLRIPDIKACSVFDLAGIIADILGKKVTSYEEIGIRAGEKLHEQLRTQDEGGDIFSSDRNFFFSKKELLELLVPIVKEYA